MAGLLNTLIDNLVSAIAADHSVGGTYDLSGAGAVQEGLDSMPEMDGAAYVSVSTPSIRSSTTTLAHYERSVPVDVRLWVKSVADESTRRTAIFNLVHDVMGAVEDMVRSSSGAQYGTTIHVLCDVQTVTGLEQGFGQDYGHAVMLCTFTYQTTKGI